MHDSSYLRRPGRSLLGCRLNRRAFLGALGAAAAGAACGPGSQPKRTGTPAPAGTPSAGGVVSWGRSLTFSGIDPHLDIPSAEVYSKLYSYLYSVTPDRVAHMNLADSMETPDPLTFNFTIRSNVRFHDIDPVFGRQVTADDVRLSFQRRGTSLTAIDKRFFKVIERMEAPDPLTFKLTLKRPFAPAFFEMANPTWAIVAPEAADKFGTLANKEAGSGPFILKEIRFGELAELVRNPHFFIPGRPLVGGHRYQVVPDQSSLLAAFRTKRFHIISDLLEPLQSSQFVGNDDITLFPMAALGQPVLMVDVRKGPFVDIRVRRAVDLAIDRQELIERISQGQAKINGPVAWALDFWALPQEELQRLYRPDVPRARQLLAEAGFPDGFKVTLKTASVPGVWTDLVTVVQSQLRRAGIQVELEFMDLGVWLTTVLVPGLFDMAWFIHPGYEEPDRPLSFYHSLGVTGQANWMGYRNQELDRLIERQQQILDEEERRALILDIQRRILNDHAPQFTTIGTIGDFAWWKDLKGYQPGLGWSHFYNWDMYLEGS